MHWWMMPPYMEAPIHRRSWTVLIVDEDVLLGQALGAALEPFGFTVSTASAAHHALRLAASRPPSAWIIDAKLPGLSGPEFAAALRAMADGALRRALVIGTSTDRGDEAAFARAGADRFVAKPAPGAAYAAVLTSALGNRAAGSDRDRSVPSQR
jgi:two-component system response regulator TctD